MSRRLAVERWLALVGFSVWFGGFTFYSAFVIPILHDRMGGVESGLVTGEVTDILNMVGVATLAAWWLLAFEERRWGKAWLRAGRVGLLILNTAILIGLVALHPIMDRQIESGSRGAFYPLHRVYLNASTVQWGANLALAGVTLLIWNGGRPEPVFETPAGSDRAD